MSPSQGPCANIHLDLWKSTNSVENIITAKRTEINLLADEKGPQQVDSGSSKYNSKYNITLTDTLLKLMVG